MRHQHSITPRSIHGLARQAILDHLGFQPYHKSVGVEDLGDLLLLMAAHTASLYATVRRFFSFSHQTATLAVHANLPGQDVLTKRLVDALFDVAQFSRLDRIRSWLIAIDTHLVPYYGKPTADVIGGLKKQGTNWFFGYATASLLHKGRRYTVALMPLHPKTKPHEIVRTLLDQIAGKNLKIRGVTLDSAFDSGDTLLLLQERELAYSVPLRRKGTGSNARNNWFKGRHRLIRWVDWITEKTRRPVTTRTVLWIGTTKTMLFAFQGWSGDRARNVHHRAKQLHRLYERRFGIETGYRQKNQAKAWTTSHDPTYRLLLEGIAYLLRQVWVVLTLAIARAQGKSLGDWIAALPLRTMLDWLAGELNALHPEKREIPLPSMSSVT